MQLWSRYATPAAVASLGVVLVEVLRASLGADVGGVGFAVAVLGLLGLPLWIGGAAASVFADVTRRGWRWGRGELPAPSGARVAAWALFGLVAAAVLVLAVQAGTVKFIKAFRRPVYQGLAAGLTAAAVVAGLALLAGPLVGVFARLFAAVSRRLPRVVDPTRARGAAVWISVAALGAAFLAPVLLSELKTVDLRPARLALLWLAALLAATWWVRTRGAPRGVGLAALIYVLAAAGAVAWAAGSLAHNQTRRLALSRDTLLAGSATARIARLADGDGDGAAAAFGGGDCDDADPAIRPGVYDAPSDGVDQNCSGEDLDRTQDPLKAPRRVRPTGPARDWNVVWLTVDALRGDMLPEFMPRLAALADETVVYESAYTHGASTYWSIPALMASTVPSRLEMGRDQTPVERTELLTEVLRDQRWHTALFANVTIFFVRGLRQGAQVANYETSHYSVHGAKPGSAHLTDGVLKHVDDFLGGRLKPKREKFFVWAHYYDPHDPYFEVPGYPAGGSDRSRYEAIVRYTDAEIGRLVDGLKARGLWQKTLFVLTADHGDEFLDHGHRFHGHSLYEEMVRVPLVLHVPEAPARRLKTPIGQMEVGPTVLDLLGVPTPGAWRGRSRVAEIRTGAPASVAPVFFEALPDSNYRAHQVGVRLGDLKLIHRVPEHLYELYDLAADPGERHNLVDEHPEAKALTSLLNRYLDHHLFWLGRGKTGAKLPPGAPGKKRR